MTATGPLQGLRVLEIATTFSGPYCTQQLADMGADVVKVESPEGDITRSLGTIAPDGRGSVFVGTNRNKSSVMLNLKAPEDLERFLQLAARSDIVLHNMRPNAAARLGIDYESVQEVSPAIIYCVITGFSSDGPYAGRPAYDDTIQAATGLAWLQTAASGKPAYVATPVADKVTGMTAAQAILSALLWRERTGEGQTIEIPMFETMTAFSLMEQYGGRAFDPPLGDTGYTRMRSPNRRPYETSDGLLAVVVYNDGHWRRFLDFTGHSEMLQQPEFKTVAARNANIDTLYELLAELLKERSTEEWLAIFEEIDVPAMPLVSLDDLFEDKHLKSTGFFQRIPGGDDAGLQTVVSTKPAARFSATPLPEPHTMTPPQMLGAGWNTARRWLAEPAPWATRTTSSRNSFG